MRFTLAVPAPDEPSDDGKGETGEDCSELENDSDSKPPAGNDEVRACDSHYSTTVNEGLSGGNTNKSTSESFANARLSSVVPNLSSSITVGAAASARSVIEEQFCYDHRAP